MNLSTEHNERAACPGSCLPGGDGFAPACGRWHAVRRLLLAAVILLLGSAPLRAQNASYGVPRVFLENRGQWNPSAAYMLDAGRMRVWFGREGVLYDLKGGLREGHVLRQRFIGAGEQRPCGEERTPGRWNFIGAGGSHTGAAGFEEVRYRGLYHGIDARYYHEGGGLKYDLIVAPWSDPGLIRVRYDGATAMQIRPGGGLRVGSSVGDLLEGVPYSYQEIGGVRRRVECRFILDERGAGFQLGPYDRSLPLVIDPALIYSSYLGGAAADEGRGITLDAGGNVYVTGYTRSENFPVTIGAYRTTIDPVNPAVPSEDIFIAKFDPTGSILLYGTYINASREDRPVAIAVRRDGVAVVAGITSSADFPVTAGAYDTSAAGGHDGFVLGLSADGDSVLFATFLGGAGEDRIESMALSAGEDVVVAGWTTSSDFPVTTGTPFHPGKDGFITRLDPLATALRSSTWLGGSGDEEILSVSVDSGGSVWATGWTASADFPADTTFGGSGGGLRDCFIIGLRPDLASSYYSMLAGGTGNDEARAISLRARTDNGPRADTIYITGFSGSGDFPVEPAGLGGTASSWFAMKVFWNGLALRATLVYSRYLGTTNGGGGYTVQGDREGRAFLAGTVRSARPDLDLLLVRLDASGRETLPNRTIGGSSDEIPWRASFLTAYGDLYLTGTTWSRDLPATTGAFDRKLNDSGGPGSDAFMLRYAFLSRPAIYARPLRDLGTLHCSAALLDTFHVYNLGEETLEIRNHYFLQSNGFSLLSPDLQARPTIAPGDSLRYIVRYNPAMAGADSNRLVIFSNDELPGRKPLEIRYRLVKQVLRADSAIAFGRVQFCAGAGATRTLPLAISLTPAIKATVEISFRSAPSAGAFRINGPARFTVDRNSQIDVLFQPKGVGLFTDTLLVVIAGSGCRDTSRVVLQGIGDTVSFAVAESELRFPPVSSCSDTVAFVDTAFTVVNTGLLPVTVTSVTLAAGTVTLLTPLPVTLPAGGSGRFLLRFRPGKRPDTVYDYPHIYIAECNLFRTLPLMAEVRAEGRPSVFPELDFGFLSGCADSPAAADSAIRIENRNGDAVAIDTIVLDDPSGTGEFIVGEIISFPLVIPPAGSAELPVRYAPAGAGADSARVLVVYRTGGCTDTIVVRLRGAQQIERVEAAEPVIEIPPLSECAGDQAVAVVLRNLSAAPVRIISVLRSDGADAMEGSLQLPFTVPAGGTVTDSVLFAPRHAGAAEERVTYVTALCGDSITVTLRGSRRGVVLTSAGDSLVFPAVLACQDVAPRLDSMLLTNNGDAGTVATILSARIRGSAAFALAGDPSGSTLAAGGGGLAIPVRFAPAGPGSYRAVLELRFDPCNGVIELPLAADVLQPALEVRGGEFGTVAVGSSAVESVTVVNRNPMPVRLERLAGVVPPFAPAGGDPLPVTLAPGDSAVLLIRFAPEFEGTFGPTAAAEITDPCSFAGNVPLAGIAVATLDSVGFCLDGFYSGGAGDTVEMLLRAEMGLELPGEAVYHIRYDWRRLQLLGIDGPPGLAGPVVGAGTGRASFRQSAGTATGDIRLRFRLLVGEGSGALARLDSVTIASALLAPAVCADSARVFIADGCLVTDVHLGKFRNLLDDARPNPAEEWVEITYQQLEDARAVLRVFDAGGREVLRPLDAVMPGGRYTIGFSVQDLPAGSYYYSIDAGRYSQAKRLLILP